MAKLATILANDRGACAVRLHYSDKHLCTVACQTARPDTVDECVCICGGVSHGQRSVAVIPGTESLVLCNDDGLYRNLLLRRGQTFGSILRAALDQPAVACEPRRRRDQIRRPEGSCRDHCPDRPAPPA
jgi:hypothetical protein